MHKYTIQMARLDTHTYTQIVGVHVRCGWTPKLKARLIINSASFANHFKQQGISFCEWIALAETRCENVNLSF